MDFLLYFLRRNTDMVHRQYWTIGSKMPTTYNNLVYKEFYFFPSTTRKKREKKSAKDL